MSEEIVAQEATTPDVVVEEGPHAAEQPVVVYEMTFDEYDDFIERATEIELYGLQPYWPTPKDIAEKGLRFTTKELALMFSWLLEMNPAPESDEEKASYRAMKQYVYDHLKLVAAPSAS